MKYLDLSNIVSGVRRLGAVRATFDHIMEAITENSDAIMRAINNNNQTNVILLWGCVNSGSGLNYIISAGAVYYQGEIYQVPAFTGTATGVQVPSLSIVTSNRAGDPVKYSDNNTFNTHKIRTMAWTIGASGAGLCDFANMVVNGVNQKVNKSGDSMSGALVSSSTGEFQGGVRTQNSGPYLLKKVINIGDWDMFNNPTKAVAHGVTFTKIRSVFAIIIDDLSSIYVPLLGVNSAFVIGGAVEFIDSTNVNLRRNSSGAFNSNNYDSTSFNRGFLLIEYEA